MKYIWNYIIVSFVIVAFIKTFEADFTQTLVCLTWAICLSVVLTRIEKTYGK